MRVRIRFFLACAALLLCLTAKAASDSYDVFVPISKYLSTGDSESLSAWFADNLEISIMSSTNDSSRNQAKQIIKTFFAAHTPRSFEINHTASRTNSTYALGYLNAGGEMFEVTIFVSKSKDRYLIQQLKIDRIR